MPETHLRIIYPNYLSGFRNENGSWGKMDRKMKFLGENDSALAEKLALVIPK